jgi:tellurite methyltransferase
MATEDACGSGAERLGERERWNRRYSERGIAPLRRRPAIWLVDNEDLLAGSSGRRALDVACGDGRNARYLAGLGLTVDAVDVSDVAIEALAAAVAQRGLPINPLRVDLTREPLPARRYDVIVQFNYLQRSLFPVLAQALVPGGVLIAETMLRAPDGHGGSGIDSRFLLEPGELRAAFPDLDVVRYREGVFERGNGPRSLASVVARRR